MRKHGKPGLLGFPARNLAPVFNDDPAYDDPHDAIDQELRGIWMSISRLRQMIRRRPRAAPGGSPVTWRQAAAKSAAPKKSTPRKQRRKAA